MLQSLARRRCTEQGKLHLFPKVSCKGRFGEWRGQVLGAVRGGQRGLAVWEGAGRWHREQGRALAAGGACNSAGPTLLKWANPSWQSKSGAEQRHG